MTDQDRIKKLPVWAQREIDVLRMHLREAEARVEALSADVPADRCIVIDEYRTPEHRVSADKHIEFRYGGQIGEYYSVRLDGAKLRVHGGRRFVIEPHSTNVLDLRQEGL